MMIIFKCTQNTQLGPKQHTEIKCHYNLTLTHYANDTTTRRGENCLATSV